MIAASLKVGGGIRLVKPAKLYLCTQKHYKHDEDGRTAPGVHGHDSVPLSHSGTSLRELDYNFNLMNGLKTLFQQHISFFRIVTVKG